MKNKNGYLREVISSMRQVDRLITREKDQGALIREACRLLSEMGGYVYSWILLLDGSGRVLDWAESCIGSDFGNLLEMAEKGNLPECVRMAMESGDLVVSREDEPYCDSCRLNEEEYEGLESMVKRLEHDGSVFGAMAAGFPADQTLDETQQGLFREIAEDIAYALHAIRMEEERDESLRSLRESEAC